MTGCARALSPFELGLQGVRSETYVSEGLCKLMIYITYNNNAVVRKDFSISPCRQRLSRSESNFFGEAERSTEHSLFGSNISDIEDAELGSLRCDFEANLLRDFLADADAFLYVIVALGVEAVNVNHRKSEAGRKQLSVLFGVQTRECGQELDGSCR